ncbi:MAG: plastocyanin/azurin family copper-binding protein [Dehalococcoidia bacterium]|nr:plastocyanin/azurin family copper-binding protein [Dehalococcoidia bacterium]
MSILSRGRGLAMLSACVGMAVIVAACGGGGGGGGGNNINVSARRGAFAFDPADVTVRANQPVTIVFRNNDSQDHDWQVRGLPGVTPESTQLYARPNQTVQKQFTFTTPGTYVIFCSLPGHEAAGMVGRLIVQ